MKILKEKNFYLKENKKLLENAYKNHTTLLLNNNGKSKYIFIDGQKDNKKCRFCDRSEDEVTFNNKSHVVPKFLGNFLIVSNFECDECNSFFSKYETELEKYIKIPLITNLNDKELKNRLAKNIKRINNKIILNGNNEKIEFNGNFVLKIFLKFAYSMLNDNEISDYNNIKNCLLNNNIPTITNILDITTNKSCKINNISLYKKIIDNDNIVDNILILDFNMKKYIIFFNKDYNDIEINESIIKNNYIELFNDFDIYNYRIRNFNKNIKLKFNLDVFMKFLNLNKNIIN